MKPPAAVWTRSTRPYVAQRREWEYEVGADVHKLSAEGQLHLKGRASEITVDRWVSCPNV